MGLAEVQSALARLYTDVSLRERFLADPGVVGQELGLSDEEIAQITHLSAPQLRFFAASLVSKRRQEVEKLLPRTRRALGRQFGTCFARYAVAPIPDGIHKHWKEALAFAAFLEQSGGQPPWVGDVLRYERAWLEASSPGRLWLVRRFGHPVGQPVPQVTDDVSLQALPPRLTIGLWFRLGRHGTLRHVLLSPPFGGRR
ncbi:MAG: hypothetical protein JO250_17430 [Armatimonadetes bacterium]|nr:hypothetical protein [Armatimonadota bacterium]